MTPLQQAIKELYFWEHNYTHCFNNMLFDLIAKADPPNRHKIAQAFPNEVEAFKSWYNQETADTMNFYMDMIPEYLEDKRQ